PNRRIPMTTTESPRTLYERSVAETAAAIRRGELSVLELNEAYIARTDALEPKVKAYAYLDREGWLAAAQELDAEAKAGAFRGPLHGIPVAVKDQFLVGGMPNTIGESWGVTTIPAED